MSLAEKFSSLKDLESGGTKVKAPILNGTFLERTKYSATCCSVTVTPYCIRIYGLFNYAANTSDPFVVAS
jgi:hypothetical protein